MNIMDILTTYVPGLDADVDLGNTNYGEMLLDWLIANPVIFAALVLAYPLLKLWDKPFVRGMIIAAIIVIIFFVFIS